MAGYRLDSRDGRIIMHWCDEGDESSDPSSNSDQAAVEGLGYSRRTITPELLTERPVWAE
jgi:hypothetical protein